MDTEQMEMEQIVDAVLDRLDKQIGEWKEKPEALKDSIEAAKQVRRALWAYEDRNEEIDDVVLEMRIFADTKQEQADKHMGVYISSGLYCELNNAKKCAMRSYIAKVVTIWLEDTKAQAIN